MTDWTIARETQLSVSEATARIEAKTADKGFRVLHTHNVSQTLREKGFPSPEYRIVEVCNAKYASEAIAADPQVGLWMPCPIAVYEHKGATHVVTARTTMIPAFFPGAGLEGFAADVERILVEIIEAALSGSAG